MIRLAMGGNAGRIALGAGGQDDEEHEPEGDAQRAKNAPMEYEKGVSPSACARRWRYPTSR